MSKTSVIYGAQHLIKLSKVDFGQITNAIRAYVSEDAPLNLGPAHSIVAVAKKDFKGKENDAYVKVGLVGKSLVLRCKLTRRLLPDIEKDGLIVKNWQEFVASYPPPPPRPGISAPLTPPPLIPESDEEVGEETGEQSGEVSGDDTSSTESVSPDPLPTSDLPQDKPVEVPVKPPETESEREARLERLREVLQRKRGDGESLADRFKRAAAKMNKLGLTPESRERMEEQGLQPLQEDYHGEVLDHQKSRYGRFLGPMRDIWEEAEAFKTHNLSEWLDAVEKNDTSVAGVSEGRTFFDQSHNGEMAPTTSGGKVDYLDDETRKPFQATVSNGKISGSMVKDGYQIFVIGPDDKLYVGSKGRASEGKEGAFNHSSFFSGGAVKSAGTLKISGGRITEVHDLSGHYAPTPSMVQLALKTFAKDKETLRKIQVNVGGKSAPGSVSLAMETPEEAEKALKEEEVKPELDRITSINTLSEKLPKHPAFHGTMDRETSEKLLAGKEGAWLLRQGSQGMVLSACENGKLYHCLLGSQAFPTAASFAELINGRKPETVIKPPPPPSPEQHRLEAVNNLAAKLTNHPAFQGNMDRGASEGLLAGREGAWLLRQGSQGVVLSVVQGGNNFHYLLGDKGSPTAEGFAKLIAGRNPGTMVKR